MGIHWNENFVIPMSLPPPDTLENVKEASSSEASEGTPANMMTPSNGNIFRVTGPLCGEFTGPGEFPSQRPSTRSFGVFFHLRLNKRLSKQPWGWWYETLPWSLWRQCNETTIPSSPGLRPSDMREFWTPKKKKRRDCDDPAAND